MALFIVDCTVRFSENDKIVLNKARVTFSFFPKFRALAINGIINDLFDKPQMTWLIYVQLLWFLWVWCSIGFDFNLDIQWVNSK